MRLGENAVLGRRCLSEDRQAFHGHLASHLPSKEGEHLSLFSRLPCKEVLRSQEPTLGSYIPPSSPLLP
ncbi:stathmin domain-containing protein 1 [Platysternon megacephalum]|uniref:Stathmin domain-containing protein 1 n=1 Tax=Platysternon megacephalum TaxID=55544 RepID=A0A4D9EH07_9SAUR|nr:stathmin domain-containing protein 1 [Platysternon megacephalum]